MPKKVKIENIGAEISAELQYFDTRLQGEIQKAVAAEADKLRGDIEQTSAVGATGKYKAGWRVSKTYDGAHRLVAVVHNKDQYRLVHLIEHGRGTAGIAARPHIFKAWEKSQARLESRIDDIIGSW